MDVINIYIQLKNKTWEDKIHFSFLNDTEWKLKNNNSDKVTQNPFLRITMVNGGLICKLYHPITVHHKS
jgi:hypothetical protein